MIAQLCYEKGLYGAAVRFWKATLDGAPELAANRQAQLRYNAACAAALAGCGQSKENPPPDEPGAASFAVRVTSG